MPRRNAVVLVVIAGLGKAKSGGINPSDVDGASSALTNLHSAATSGGTGFADNANASITG